MEVCVKFGWSAFDSCHWIPTSGYFCVHIQVAIGKSSPPIRPVWIRGEWLKYWPPWEDLMFIAHQIITMTTFYSRRRSKKTSKLRVTGVCVGNSPVTGEFPAQRVSNTENVSIDDVTMYWAIAAQPREPVGSNLSGLAIIPSLTIRSQQIFAHVTTAQLSWHVQNFVAITVLASRWEWNEISIEFELWWKSR